MEHMDEKSLCRICEEADAEAWWSMLEAAEPSFRERFQIKSERSGTMVVGATGTFDVVALNRAVGVQLDHATSVNEVRRIIRLFDECGSRRYAIQLCPSSTIPEVLNILKQEGFTRFNNWTKLIRKTSERMPEPDSAVRVERIDASMAATFADIVAPAFGWPGLMKQWLARMVGRESWVHYLAFDDGEPAASAAMFIHGQTAWLGFAATKQEFRRRGAQSALIHRRLADALASGCQHVVAETAEEQPERPNPSYHNLVRHGFREAYQRPNYLRIRDTRS